MLAETGKLPDWRAVARVPASDFYLVASGDAVFAGGEQIWVTRQRRATAAPCVGKNKKQLPGELLCMF